VTGGAQPAPRLVDVGTQATALPVHGTREETALPDAVYVGLITRALALAVDAAILNAVAAIVAAAAALVISVFPVSHALHSALVAVGGVVFVLWVLSYFTTFWAATGQTPGDRLMEIRVTRPDGSAVRPRRALVRVVGVGLAVIPLFAGFIPILFSDRRRGLADWLADTVVVRALPPTGPRERHARAPGATAA
jgi:uncharacterized RDD family membrane protein YckC